MKNRENIALQNMIFVNIDFRAFFDRFQRFRIDFGRRFKAILTPPSIENKLFVYTAHLMLEKTFFYRGGIFDAFREGAKPQWYRNASTQQYTTVTSSVIACISLRMRPYIWHACRYMLSTIII